MVSDKLKAMMEEQMRHEIYSAHLYLQMSAWFDDHGYSGYANYYYVQYQEEIDHFKIFFKYLEQVGMLPKLGAIEAPEHEYSGVLEILEKTLEHERKVTEYINKLADQAWDERDFKSINLLNWFIDEQVEEEDNASTNIDRYKAFAESQRGLYDLDSEMGARGYTKTTKLAELEA